MIQGITEITGAISDDDLNMVPVMSAGLDGWLLNIPEVEICRTVLLWKFLHSFLFARLLYFFTTLDLRQVQMVSAQVITTSRDLSSGDGVSPCTRSTKWLAYSTYQLWD